MKRLLALILAVAPAALARDGDSWVVVRSDKGATMHGDISDLESARKHLKEFGPGYLWFRRDGKQYVVRDGKVLEAIEEAVKPQEALGEEQGRLGERQADLGRQQAKLGGQQAELGHAQARMALRRASEDREERRRDRDEERELEETQKELSRAQEVLGREQEKIGREQEKMGREQERLAKQAQRKVEQLIEASLRDGTAKPVD
jgi:bla regulator protein blaR1